MLNSDSDTDTESYCDSYSTDSYDGTDNWPLHADCKFSGDAGIGSWLISPRSLRNLSALEVVRSANVEQLSTHEVPSTLYPILLCEACRIRNSDMVSHIVSVWPHQVLNLNTLEVPLDAMGTYFTKSWGKETMSLAEMIVRGLLNARGDCKLRKVVLPHSECEAMKLKMTLILQLWNFVEHTGSEMTKLFSRLPLFAFRDIPKHHLKKMIHKQLTKNFKADEYLKEVTMPPFTVNMRREEPIVISLPGVIQWLGKHKNYKDVMVGLALQTYYPFHFSLEKVVLNNALDLSEVNRILQMIALPEQTRKIVVNNHKRTEAMHILLKIGALHHVLVRFSKVEAFICKFDGMYMLSLHGQNHVLEVMKRCASVFSAWTCLKEINLSGNLLHGRLRQLLQGVKSNLVKLNLSATGLCGDDIQFLASSRHVESVQYLNLDYNELNASFIIEPVKKLLRSLKSLVCLRMSCTGINSVHATSYAEALVHLDTLKSWTLLQNQLGTLQELVHFIHTAAKIPNIKEIGCKPFELHALFAGLYVQSTGPPALNDNERQELKTLAEKYNITVY